MKSKLLAALAAMIALAGCSDPTEYKINDFEGKRTIYFWSVDGYSPGTGHGGVLIIDMPGGRRIVLRDYNKFPTDKHIGQTLIVPGIE